MYAIIHDGGHQYKVEAGQTYRVQLKDAEVGDSVTFDKFAALGGDDLTLGKPYVDGAAVQGTVVRHLRGKKIVVRKFRRRKNYHRKQGHRQDFTEIRIDQING